MKYENGEENERASGNKLRAVEQDVAETLWEFLERDESDPE